jgi:predicted dehydrogenase
MSGNRIRELLGRRLRIAFVGGGSTAMIGPVHRLAARLDDFYEPVASALSADPARSVAEGAALGIARPYASFEALIAGEAARADKADAIAIATPNDLHLAQARAALDAGYAVICDKPLTNTLAEAQALQAAVRRTGLPFLLLHNYSGYPMVREARACVAAGELGKLNLARVSYLQGSLGQHVEAEGMDGLHPRLQWRLDPARGGSHVMADIGTHAHHLLTYISGARVASVRADVGASFDGRTADDTASALLRLEGGARASFLASKAATGAENALSIELYGDKGGLLWEQASMNVLKIMRPMAAFETRSRGLASLHPLARRASRISAGHPEGFFEAFANLMSDFADILAARLTGQTPDPLALHIPGIDDGVAGVAFVEACLLSSKTGAWTDCA